MDTAAVSYREDARSFGHFEILRGGICRRCHRKYHFLSTFLRVFIIKLITQKRKGSHSNSNIALVTSDSAGASHPNRLELHHHTTS